MSRTFSSREVLLLVAFAGGLAVVDTVSRSSSGCVQCEVDLVQRSLEQRVTASPKRGETSPETATTDLSR